jgi:hypothetical protein
VRLNATLPPNHRIHHAWLDRAVDCAKRLGRLEKWYANTAASVVLRMIEAKGADPNESVLLVFCKGLPPEVAAMPSEEQRDCASLVATFLSASQKSVEERVVGSDYLEDLELMESGLMFYRRYAALAVTTGSSLRTR